MLGAAVCRGNLLRASALPLRGFSGGLKKTSFGLTGDPTKSIEEDGSYLKLTCTRSNLRAIGWQDEDFDKVDKSNDWNTYVICGCWLCGEAAQFIP